MPKTDAATIDSESAGLADSSVDASGPQVKPRGPLSLRVVLLALVLIPLNAWWLTEIEYIRYSDNATTQALFFNTISLLLILVGANAVLKRLKPSWVFSAPEMAALYVAITVATGLAGTDQMQILFTTITYVYPNATAENGWADKIIPYLPAHLVVSDRAALAAIYSGHSTLYRWDHIRPWLTPLGWWSLFILMVVWAMMCLSALFRKQWDNERLSYPIVEVPLQIITNTSTLFRSRLLWAGFAIGAAGDLFNFLHMLAPSIPALPIGVQYFQAQLPPWNAAGQIAISLFPFAIGLAFLLPTQLSFSTWFFMMLSRVELVAAAAFGFTQYGRFPFIQQQQVGAMFGIFLALLWTGRGHLTHVWRCAIGDKNHAGYDSGEPMRYRTAVFGFFAGIAAMVAFAVEAGMRFPAACFYLTIFFIIVLVVARMRAELGLPTFELLYGGADQIMINTAGASSFTRGDLSVMSLFFWLSRTHRQFPMEAQVDGIQLAKRTGSSLGQMTGIILGATALGIVATFWAFLHTLYQTGFNSAHFQGPALWAFGDWPFERMGTWIATPQPPDMGSLEGYGFGCIFALFLTAMRLRFYWWPFHPVGYMVAGSYGLFRLWFPIFLSWLAKSLILRYGGLRGYHVALPFFIGLILGEFSAGFVRTCLDLAFGLHLPASSGMGGL
jgi:hypothetical protein